MNNRLQFLLFLVILSCNTKITDPKYYAASVYAATRDLAHKHRSTAFRKAEIDHRTTTLRVFVTSRWSLW